jgi:hypothetical protein
MNKILTLALLLAFAASLQAAPAPWYQWQSKQTGRYLCAQFSPGDGWVLHAGPYRNAGCRAH